MKTHNLIQPPTQPQQRTRNINLRLTEAEYTRVTELAQAHNLPTAVLARDFLFQAVSVYEAAQTSDHGERK